VTKDSTNIIWTLQQHFNWLLLRLSMTRHSSSIVFVVALFYIVSLYTEIFRNANPPPSSVRWVLPVDRAQKEQ